jgi:hypothetical protein
MMTNQNETTSKRPTHTAYFLKAKEASEKPDWIKAGVAWEHTDQQGLNLVLTIFGQDVNLVIRPSKAK